MVVREKMRIRLHSRRALEFNYVHLATIMIVLGIVE